MNGELLVRLKDVKLYQQDKLILEDVQLNVESGEFVYLIGKTGMGKSTLLRCLYGDLHLADGEGEVVGFDLRKLRRKDLPWLRRKLGIVFQDFHLLTDRNVAANLLFTLRATGWTDLQEMQARMEEVMEMVGLHGRGRENPYELSGGEQQRVVIARALLNHPELILADEPTGNLDPDTADDILRLLGEISNESKAGVILATHNYTLIDKFPARIIKCQDGKLQDFKHTRVN